MSETWDAVKRDSLVTAMPKIWEDRRQSGDLSVICGSEELALKTHKLILCARSDFFKAACEGAFKEFSTGTIKMPDDEISYVWRMACFCYGLSYSPQKAAVDNVWISAAHTHAMVYSLGDKYAVNGLQEYASLRFETELKKALSSAFWAARRDGSNLQDAVGKALEGFDETVKAVYTTTPDSDRALRDIIVAFINEKWKMVRSLPIIAECFVTFPEFAIDLMDAQKKEKEGEAEEVEKMGKGRKRPRGSG